MRLCGKEKIKGVYGMDDQRINVSKINDFGIVYGKETAPNTLITFVNLRCPFCRIFWEKNIENIKKLVESGQLKWIIKLLDKVNPGLQRGNIMHHHISLDSPSIAIAEIQEILDSQDYWGGLSLSEVAYFAKEKLKLTEQMNDDYITAVFREAQESGVVIVPTAIFGDFIFDEHLSEQEFLDLFEKK